MDTTQKNRYTQFCSKRISESLICPMFLPGIVWHGWSGHHRALHEEQPQTACQWPWPPQTATGSRRCSVVSPLLTSVHYFVQYREMLYGDVPVIVSHYVQHDGHHGTVQTSIVVQWLNQPLSVAATVCKPTTDQWTIYMV